MPALKPTTFAGEIVWLGTVTAKDRTELMSETRFRLDLSFAGLSDSVHCGLTRASCVRVASQYRKGTSIRNERQLSILSVEELDQIAAKMGVEHIDPARVGASIVVRGIPDFSHVPPSSRLQAPSGATLTIDMENRPCSLPARSIETVNPGHGKAFSGSHWFARCHRLGGRGGAHRCW